MRIVHVSDCYAPRVGGIECQIDALAALQRRAGHEVSVVTTTTGRSVRRGDDVSVWRPPRRHNEEDGRMRYGCSLRGRKVVLAGEFDLVHIHASAFSPLAFLTAASTAARGIPTVVTVHSLWSYASPLFRAADLLTGWGRWRVAWSAVSHLAAEPLERVVGPTSSVAVVPNGVDAASWRIAPTKRRPGVIVLATVGRLAVRKRPQPFLRMLQKVRARLPGQTRLEVVIVGDGPLRPSLERFVVDHDMSDWVRLRGAANHDDLRTLYASVDFYVAPATLESFGIAALEARCAGLPVVAFAASGVADFINHDVEGLLARDDDGMIESILRLAESPTTLERMRRHNTANAPRISWPGVVEQCEALYAQAREISLDTREPSASGRVRAP